MSGKLNRVSLFAATLAVVAVLGSAALSYAQRDSSAKARGVYNTETWNTNSSQSRSGKSFGSSQSSQSRQSYSYDPSDKGDVAARGPGCAPKLSSKPADDSKAQAKKQTRRSYSHKPAEKSNKSAKSDVAARGPGCAPKLNSKPADDSNAQAKKNSRRSHSYDPSQESDSSNRNWNQGKKINKQEPWAYPKGSPKRNVN